MQNKASSGEDFSVGAAVSGSQARTRIERLERMREAIASATGHLTTSRRRMNLTVRIRPGFVRLESSAPSYYSDRKLPPDEYRPPATRIMAPRGIALRLYLIGLFHAQAVTAPGRVPVPVPLQDPHRTSWADLIAVDARRQGRGRVAASVHDKKLRQLHNALKRLASPQVQLMYLPQEEQRSGRYDLPQLLDEEGPRSDGTVKDYVVPEERDEVVRLPDGLFVNGWIHVLEDTELAFLLMIAHEMQMRGEPSVSISSHVRLYHFGIGPHAHGKHLLLQRFGLLHTDVDSSRDEKGRVPHPNDPLLLGLHRFRLLTDGFSRPAVDVVIDALNDHPGS